MSFRILLDENFPKPAVKILQASSLNVLAISDSHAGIDDPAVLMLAREEQRLLATFDLDFGDLLFAQRLPAPPAVILFRVPHYRPEEPAQWVIDWVHGHPSPLGMFTVFDGKTMRSRALIDP